MLELVGSQWKLYNNCLLKNYVIMLSFFPNNCSQKFAINNDKILETIISTIMSQKIDL